VVPCKSSQNPHRIENMSINMLILADSLREANHPSNTSLQKPVRPKNLEYFEIVRPSARDPCEFPFLF